MYVSVLKIQSTQLRFYVFCATTSDKFYLEQANCHGDRPLSPPHNGQQGAVAVVRGDRPLYGCIYKTHSFPVMLVSISMCVFSMILKYRTLYSNSKMSLIRVKLVTNYVHYLVYYVMVKLLLGEVTAYIL